jgi:hypothetical protein
MTNIRFHRPWFVIKNPSTRILMGQKQLNKWINEEANKTNDTIGITHRNHSLYVFCTLVVA